MHLFEEYGYVEFLDTEYEEKKRIIGTNLHNYAMPLLRYETNDIALITYTNNTMHSNSTCSHTARTVKNIVGRANSTLKLKDREIPITNFYTLMEKFHDVGSWQIVQHKINEIELISEFELNKESRETLMNEFSVRLPEDVKFYISERKEFIKTREGKKNAFIDIATM